MSVRVLVVEDEPGISDFLIRGLSEEGYAVSHAADGPHAWLRLQSETWDLIIFDWWLPGEDGLQIIQRFRQKNRITPVLFLTARDGVGERVTGLDAGADDYLTKPFAFEELLARVRTLLRRQGQSDSLHLEYQDIRIDLAQQRATRGAMSLDLTAKELSLLTMFLRHPGRVLSRTRIYETVWDENFDGSSNTLEVHVKDLRRKLEKLGPRRVELKQWLETQSSTWSAQSRSADLRLDIRLNEQVRVRATPALLGRVVDNLVFNAISSSLQVALNHRCDTSL